MLTNYYTCLFLFDLIGPYSNRLVHLVPIYDTHVLEFEGRLSCFIRCEVTNIHTLVILFLGINSHIK